MRNYFLELGRTYIIAEIGVNHNGCLNLAKKMVESAKSAGADAVKFQTFKASSLVSQGTPKVRYQELTTSQNETHYEMIQRLELSEVDHIELMKYCSEIEIDFLSTPYDIESAKFLLELNIEIFKTASADLVDLPLQRFIASTGKPVIIATGMSNLGEIDRVVDIYNRAGNGNLIFLHCVSNYPCSDQSLNMLSMKTLHKAFGFPIGYSDHSVDSMAAILSIALGAKVVEKHFTLDRMLEGPDHKASSTPSEFAELVTNIRRAEIMLGSRRKSIQDEERQMAAVSRKSLVFRNRIEAGQLLREEDLVLMRPGTGIGAEHIPLLIGRRIANTKEAGQQLLWVDLI